MQRKPSRRREETKETPPSNFDRQAYELLCRLASPLVPIAVQDTDAIMRSPGLPPQR